MKDKIKNKKGFTLAELLIVVAIIAILIAIMVPVFSTSRADAIQAKDAANVRSAYSEAVVKAMTDHTAYDNSTGKLNISVDTGSLDLESTVELENGNIKVTTNGASEPEVLIKVDENVTVQLNSGSSEATH